MLICHLLSEFGQAVGLLFNLSDNGNNNHEKARNRTLNLHGLWRQKRTGHILFLIHLRMIRQDENHRCLSADFYLQEFAKLKLFCTV